MPVSAIAEGAAATYQCVRCETLLQSTGGPPPICEPGQGGCGRKLVCAVPCDHGDETKFRLISEGPPGRAKLALEIDGLYRHLRPQGLTEPQALEVIDRDEDLWREGDGGIADIEGFRAFVREMLRSRGILDEWPVGWDEADTEKLTDHMTFEDVVYWVSRIIDAPREDRLIAILLSAQGHLAPLLRAIGPAIHGIPESPGVSAGKSRCAEALTYLGGGRWYASATIPRLKAVRSEAPVVVGIDEGDEAEKDNPGIKAYLLACHDWEATYGKFGEPDAKGRRSPEDIRYGGPVFITFRKKPWTALLSRTIVFAMHPTKDARFSDDGAGEGFKRLLRPAAIWLRKRCEAALRDHDGTWALLRTHERDFKATLDRIAKDSELLRQRDNARSLLFIAESLGVDLEAEIRKKAIEEPELESENQAIIDAIEGDPLHRKAIESGEPVPVEELRLSVQKFLRDHREHVDLTRNKFASVLAEMGYSKAVGPTWKRVERDRKEFMAIFPSLLPKGGGGMRSAPGAPALHMETPQTPQTPHTPAGDQHPDFMFGLERARDVRRYNAMRPVHFIVGDLTKELRARGREPDMDQLTAGVIKGMKAEDESL